MAEDFERPSLEPKGTSYRLTKDWHTDAKGTLDGLLLVPAGFVTDGASIPRFLWRVCGSPMDVPRIFAAIVHDWVYTKSGNVTIDGQETPMNRKEADRIYRDYQIALGISRIKAYTEYGALRLFGGSHWGTDEENA